MPSRHGAAPSFGVPPSQATEPGLREPLARALVNKGVTLGELQRSDDACETLGEIVDLFGSSDERSIQSVVTAAMKLQADLGGTTTE